MRPCKTIQSKSVPSTGLQICSIPIQVDTIGCHWGIEHFFLKHNQVEFIDF